MRAPLALEPGSLTKSLSLDRTVELFQRRRELYELLRRPVVVNNPPICRMWVRVAFFGMPQFKKSKRFLMRFSEVPLCGQFVETHCECYGKQDSDLRTSCSD